MPRHVRHPQRAAAAPPERPAARGSAVWTSGSAWVRGAPQRCPGVQAAGRAVGKADGQRDDKRSEGCDTPSLRARRQRNHARRRRLSRAWCTGLFHAICRMSYGFLHFSVIDRKSVVAHRKCSASCFWRASWFVRSLLAKSQHCGVPQYRDTPHIVALRHTPIHCAMRLYRPGPPGEPWHAAALPPGPAPTPAED